MADPIAADPTPDNFGDLPIQPTGSGVADLEIAYEQMRLAEDTDAADMATDADTADEIAAHHPVMTPVTIGKDAAESIA